MLLTNSSDQTFEVTKTMLTVLKAHLINKYTTYCSKIQFECLKRTSLYSILNIIKPMQQKSLQGLDYYFVDGNSAIDELIKIVEFYTSEDQAIAFKKLAEDVRVHLKIEFIKNCALESPCASHCGAFAVSDPLNQNLSRSCRYKHTEFCVYCTKIFKMFVFVHDVICDHSDNQTLLWQVENATKAIKEWQMHLIRHFVQNQLKVSIINRISDGNLFLLFDWQMRPLPRKFMEKQSEWFGKQGLSSHITVATTMVNNVLVKKSIVLVSDSCDQDMCDTICVIEATVNRCKEIWPHTHSIIAKMDNAGCYSG